MPRALTDTNRRTTLIAKSDTDEDAIVEVTANPLTGAINVETTASIGTQYESGDATPATPVGTIPVFDNAGTITHVSAANPLPVSATIDTTGLALAANQLPDGHAVAATLAAETTKVIGTVRVASGGIASGSIASGAIAVGAITAGNTSIATTEDTARAAGEHLVKIGLSRLDTPVANANVGADNEYTNFTADNFGKLWVAGSVIEDAAESAGMSLMAAGTVRRDSASSSAGTTGDNATLNTDANGKLWTNTEITVALPAGTNAIGKLSSNSGVDIGDVDVLTLPGVAGTAAHDAAVSGNPILNGAEARSTDQTAVASGDATRFQSTLTGKQVIMPYAIPENSLSGTASATNTSDTSIIAAQGSGIRIYVTSIIISNSSATATEVVIKSATTARITYPAPATSGAVHSLPFPLQLAANEALNFASLASVTTMKVSAVGYKGV